MKLWVFHGALQDCFTYKIMIYMQNLNPMTKFLTHWVLHCFLLRNASFVHVNSAFSYYVQVAFTGFKNNFPFGFFPLLSPQFFLIYWYGGYLLLEIKCSNTNYIFNLSKVSGLCFIADLSNMIPIVWYVNKNRISQTGVSALCSCLLRTLEWKALQGSDKNFNKPLAL